MYFALKCFKWALTRTYISSLYYCSKKTQTAQIHQNTINKVDIGNRSIKNSDQQRQVVATSFASEISFILRNWLNERYIPVNIRWRTMDQTTDTIRGKVSSSCIYVNPAHAVVHGEGDVGDPLHLIHDQTQRPDLQQSSNQHQERRRRLGLGPRVSEKKDDGRLRQSGRQRAGKRGSSNHGGPPQAARVGQSDCLPKTSGPWKCCVDAGSNRLDGVVLSLDYHHLVFAKNFWLEIFWRWRFFDGDTSMPKSEKTQVTAE